MVTKKMSWLISIFMLFLTVSCNQNGEKTTVKSTEPNTVTTLTTKKNILFFGNSLTAGYGLDDASTAGFVGLTQQKIDAESLPYRCINAGLSGETTAGGNSRIDWVIEQQPVDIFILELGGNDALRGLKTDDSARNLQSILDKVKVKYPSVKIILSGMEAPRSMGTAYTTAFHNIYPNLAKKNTIALIPFVLEGVGGIAELNQKDGIHPTAEGNKIIVETIWKVLKPML
ncbi:MAG: arylesterase [Saprospiraceae bacterium]|nr:arylesterase [Saprospiraceae bacterium]